MHFITARPLLCDGSVSCLVPRANLAVHSTVWDIPIANVQLPARTDLGVFTQARAMQKQAGLASINRVPLPSPDSLVAVSDGLINVSDAPAAAAPGSASADAAAAPMLSGAPVATNGATTQARSAVGNAPAAAEATSSAAPLGPTASAGALVAASLTYLIAFGTTMC